MAVTARDEQQKHDKLLTLLRALMSRTVANGCTADEELAAARMVGKLVAQIDAMGGGPAAPAEAQANWAKEERNSDDYKQALQRTTLESLFKAAVQELALNHINTVSPPRRRFAGEFCERVPIYELLGPHLGMMLGISRTRLGSQILRDAIDELVDEGSLPANLDIPIGR